MTKVVREESMQCIMISRESAASPNLIRRHDINLEFPRA